MALTFVQLCDELSVCLGTASSSTDDLRTSFKRWINQACRTIAYAYPWDSMRAEQRIATVAPYSTGTATFTLDSTTVTGSGTTWTSAMVGRKIALSAGSPYYRIATRVSNTEITIAEAYAEATATGTTYTLFQDEYDLAATTHSVEDAVLIKDNHPTRILGVPQRQMDGLDYVGTASGRPYLFTTCANTTVGTPRVRLYPVPDAVYRISFRYLKTWTDLSSDSDLYTTQGLPADVEELILDRALRWSNKVEGTRAVMPDNAWKAALRDVWQSYRRQRYSAGQRVGLGGSLGTDGLIVNTTGVV